MSLIYVVIIEGNVNCYRFKIDNPVAKFRRINILSTFEINKNVETLNVQAVIINSNISHMAILLFLVFSAPRRLRRELFDFYLPCFTLSLWNPAAFRYAKRRFYNARLFFSPRFLSPRELGCESTREAFASFVGYHPSSYPRYVARKVKP